MSANPMMEQVGRLIGGLLAGGGEVFLPGVGSLYTERQPARRINRREVLPPQRRVTFTSQQRGTSLVDEIARVLQTNGAETDNLPTMAQSVYDRWIARALEGETLTVDGVGVLKHKHFTPDEAFDRRLNPQGSKPVRLPRPRRRFDWACWIGVVAIVCAAGIGLYAWQMFRIDASETIPATRLTPARTTDSLSVNARPDSVAAQTPATPATPSTPSAAGTPAAPATPATPAAPAAPKPAPAAAASAPAALISGHHYVVLGVFSTAENAARAASAASSQEVAITCGVYRFGAKFMVSPFESDDAEACRLFIRAHAERIPDMWVYSAR
ncbi:MAG TPA: hypothetical protein H9920_03290 [Candidatus Alistipes faecavium]|nr:hypothetical protein [Candidatus Alistipes faecavium]